jgi:hypothetical protein
VDPAPNTEQRCRFHLKNLAGRAPENLLGIGHNNSSLKEKAGALDLKIFTDFVSVNLIINRPSFSFSCYRKQRFKGKMGAML